MLFLKRFTIISGIFLLPFFSLSVSRERYESIFGRDYQSALDFLVSNPWISDSLTSCGVNPCEALPVIFPELIRYSSLRDKFETLSLQSLYIKYGKKYSDFSIGHFQMKPSFAEELEKYYRTSPLFPLNFTPFYDTADSESARKARVIRLASVQGQVTYLSLFMRCAEDLLPESMMLTTENRVKYISASYNSGFYQDSGKISEYSGKSCFYTGVVPPDRKYCYSEISLEFFHDHCGKGKFY